MCMHVCLFTEASRGYQVFWSWSYIDGYYPPSVIAKNQGWVFCKSRYRELNLRLLQEQPVLISTGPPLSYPFFSSSSRSVSPGKCHGCFGCLSISLWNSSDPNWWVHRRLPFYLSVLRFFLSVLHAALFPVPFKSLPSAQLVLNPSFSSFCPSSHKAFVNIYCTPEHIFFPDCFEFSVALSHVIWNFYFPDNSPKGRVMCFEYRHAWMNNRDTFWEMPHWVVPSPSWGHHKANSETQMVRVSYSTRLSMKSREAVKLRLREAAAGVAAHCCTVKVYGFWYVEGRYSEITIKV